jgi:peptidoglycan/xylan/chitin deacetylase (PgdA/CDA1 family)
MAAGLSWASGSLWLRRHTGIRPRVRVLTYHRVRNARWDPFSVTPAEFDAQMAWLSTHQTVIALNDLMEFLAGRRELPNDAVLVTIDDGYEDLRSNALPILTKHGIPAVAFITAGEMAGGGDEPDRKLSRAEVAALRRDGVSVGSHAWDHRSLGRMTAEQAAYQATMSRETLEEVTRRHVKAFAYPYGTRLDFNATTATALRSAGYRCAFTSQHGPVTRHSHPMELPRIKIEGADPFWVFRLAARGGLDGWSLVDRFCATFQSTERGSRAAEGHAARPSLSTRIPQ